MGVTKRDYKIAVVILWCLSLLFLVCTVVSFFYRPELQYEYGVIVDISSYDIEFNLYKWDNKDRHKNTAKIMKMYTISCDINVHRSNFNVDKFREEMFKCMSHVISHVQNYEIYNSTFFVYGTELTRLMCKNEYRKCAAIFSVTVEVLSSFEMQLSVLNARVLKGYQEALFGWISVNDILGKLETGVDLYGGLDMKNYSLLISHNDPSVHYASEFQNSSIYTLYGHKYNLRGIDMMCYGFIQAFNRATIHLINMAGIFGGISHPCLPSSFNQEFFPKDLISPCVEYGGTKNKVTIKGDWNLARCKSLIKETLDDYDKSNDAYISSIVTKFPFGGAKFFGFSRIAEVASLINFDGKDLSDLYRFTMKLCDSNPTVKYEYACFDILYLQELIVERLKILPENVIIGHQEKVETVTGSMVYHSGAIVPRKGLPLFGMFGIVFLAFSVVVFASLALFMSIKIRTYI